MIQVSDSYGNRGGTQKMNRKDYRRIAKKHGVSIQEVKRDMQEAVDATYVNPTFHARCVYSKGEKPTVDEFVTHVVRRVKAGCNG